MSWCLCRLCPKAWQTMIPWTIVAYAGHFPAYVRCGSLSIGVNIEKRQLELRNVIA